MRSPLDAISGQWNHAVFTTYTLSLPFFESYVLPMLSHAGVRNVVVLADRDQLGEALRNPTVRRAGTAYHVVGVSIGPGVFHPKVMLLSSAAASRLVVSSGNLTVSGQLRNLEIATVLQSTERGQVNAVIDGAVLMNRLTEYVPVHVADAIHAATASTIDLARDSDDESHVKFVHNLDVPLIGSIPDGALTALAPFADRNGATAMRLAADRPVEVLVDGERFEASEAFFDAGFPVTPLSFDRPLHAKAYWTDGESMAGSPNLTQPALARTAETGNTEVAVVTPIAGPLAPPSSPYVGDIATEAPRRIHRFSPDGESSSKGRVRAFNAWEAEGVVRVELPDGAVVDRPAIAGWVQFGVVAAGEVVPDEAAAAPPRVLRAVIGDVEFIGVVHRVVDLRIRRHARRASGAAATVSGTAPLDAESQKLLKGVLDELFTLTILLSEEEAKPPALMAKADSSDPEQPVRLSDWRPAHPGDDPNVPAMYRTSWASDPDELLALVRQALRLDQDDGRLDDRPDLDETDLDDLGDDERETDDPDTEEWVPLTSRVVLSRYRGSFMRLLRRGVNAIEAAPSEDLRDLVFQVLIEQTDRLAITVTIKADDGTEESDQLVPLVDLNSFRLDALDAYLANVSSPDPVCIQTARRHIAECLANQNQWSLLEWERIENLVLTHAADLGTDGIDGIADGEGMDPGLVAAYLEPYIDRGTWDHIIDAVSHYLEDVTVTVDPVPIVAGSAAIDPFAMSPAWEALGAAAFAGFSDDAPFAVRVMNLDESNPWSVQTFVVDPPKDRLYEVLDNRNTGARMMRRYRPVTRGMLEKAGRLGPRTLTDASRTTVSELPRSIALICDAVPATG